MTRQSFNSPPVNPVPLKDRVSVDDPENVRTVYEILCDATLKRGETIPFRIFGFELVRKRKNTADETVYAGYVMGDRNKPFDYLVLDHQAESVVCRNREYYPGEDPIDETDIELDGDVYERKYLEQQLTFE